MTGDCAYAADARFGEALRDVSPARSHCQVPPRRADARSQQQSEDRFAAFRPVATPVVRNVPRRAAAAVAAVAAKVGTDQEVPAGLGHLDAYRLDQVTLWGSHNTYQQKGSLVAVLRAAGLDGLDEPRR